MQFASRVELYGVRGLICYVTPGQAERLLKSPNVKRITPGKRCTDLLAEDFNPTEKNGEHRPSNSLRSGYRQSLSGGELISIETERESRTLTTEPCHSYKLKHIREELRPLYRAAVLENLA